MTEENNTKNLENMFMQQVKQSKLCKGQGAKKPNIMPFGSTPKKKKIRKGYSYAQGWAKKLKLQHLKLKDSNDFHRFIVPREKSIDLIYIIEPLIQEYIKNPETKINPLVVKSAATSAATAAVKRFGIKQETLEENKIVIENYVNYNLFFRELTGENKFFLAGKINLEGVLDDKGKVQFLKVFQKEAEIFDMEAKVDGESYITKKIIKQEAERLLESGEYTNESGIYFITEKLRKDLENTDLTPTKVYDCLKVKDANFKKPEMSLESVLVARDLLSTSSLKQLSGYGSNIGIYLLAKDIRQITGENIPLSNLYSLLKTNKHVKSFLNNKKADEKISKINWNPNQIDMNYQDMQDMGNHLLKRYNQQSNVFFNLYGSFAGPIILAKELEKISHRKLNLFNISNILSKGEFIGNLIGAGDNRFVDKWYAKPISMSLSESENVVSFLKEQYETNPDLFFSIYSNKNNGKAKIIKDGTKIEINSQDATNLFADGKTLSLLMGVQDERFALFKNTYSPTKSLDYKN